MSRAPDLRVYTRSTLSHQRGGMEAVVADLVDEWAETGHTVEIITTTLPRGATRPDEGYVEIKYLSGTKPSRYTRGWWRSSARYEISAPTPVIGSISVGSAGHTAARSDPSRTWIMQCHGTGLMEIQGKARSRNLRGCATMPKAAEMLLRDMRAYGRYKYLACIGPAVYDSIRTLQSVTGLRHATPVLISNTVSVRSFSYNENVRRETRQRLKIGAQDLVVLLIGRLHPEKRVAQALDAVALHAMSISLRVVVLVVGSGPEIENVRAAARHHASNITCVFVGDCPREFVNEFYCASDVLLSASIRAEGLPMSFLEALASGLELAIPAGIEGLSFATDKISTCDPLSVTSVANALRSALARTSGAHRVGMQDGTTRGNAERYVRLLRDAEGL